MFIDPDILETIQSKDQNQTAEPKEVILNIPIIAYDSDQEQEIEALENKIQNLEKLVEQKDSEIKKVWLSWISIEIFEGVILNFDELHNFT